MKNMKPLLWIFICLMVPFLFACPGKDPKPKSKTEMIIKTWKVREARIGGNVVYTNPASSAPNNPDFTQYSLTFRNATDFTRKEIGGVSETSGTWQFNDNNNPTRITFSTGNPSEVSVETLEDNRLILTYVVTSPKTGNIEYRIEFVPGA
jgi:hypothetical protein